MSFPFAANSLSSEVFLLVLGRVTPVNPTNHTSWIRGCSVWDKSIYLDPTITGATICTLIFSQQIRIYMVLSPPAFGEQLGIRASKNSQFLVEKKTVRIPIKIGQIQYIFGSTPHPVTVTNQGL